MPAERIAMRQVRDVLRLHAAGVSGNEIARRARPTSTQSKLGNHSRRMTYRNSRIANHHVETSGSRKSAP
jgi:hypothetical protein